MQIEAIHLPATRQQTLTRIVLTIMVAALVVFSVPVLLSWLVDGFDLVTLIVLLLLDVPVGLSWWLEHSMEAIYTFDIESRRVLTANPAFWRLLGYTEEPLPTLTIDDFIADSRQSIDDNLMHIVGAGAMTIGERQWRRRDGALLDVYVSASKVRQEERDVVFVIVHDVTARVRAEEAARRYAERLKTLYEISQAILAAESPETIAQAALDRLRQLVPYQRAGVALVDLEAGQATVLAALVDGEPEARTGGHFPLTTDVEILRRGEVYHATDVAALALSGSDHDHYAAGMRSYVSVPLIAHGELLGSLNLASPEPGVLVAEHVEIAREVADELAVAIQQARLHRQLQARAAELERSNAELQQFAYAASHDLQEPLGTVSGYLQLLEQRYRGQLDAKAEEFIDLAVDGVARMDELIRGLLAYSRVSTHRQPYQLTDSQAVLQRVLKNMVFKIEDHGATVTHDPLPSVWADPIQLEQLFQNLLGNALKFHGPQAPQIHVSVRRLARGENQEGDGWLFAVRDNGIGIDPRDTERIFAIFQRLHSRDAYPGSGIGLAICRRIVERHGGRIWVESQPGHGSTFYFTLAEQAV